MRPTKTPPPFDLPLSVNHQRARELLTISQVLDAHPELETLVLQDLIRGLVLPEQGRPGMTARQVLRVLVIKQMTQLSYQALAFALADSVTYRLFCGFESPTQVPGHSALQDNLARLTAATLEQLNAVLLEVAKEYKVETGAKVRIDCTVTLSPIHPPTDSGLLFDSIRSLTLVMNHAHEAALPLRYQDRTSAAKRLALAIHQAPSDEQRRPLYEELLELTFHTLQEAHRGAELLEALPPQPHRFKWAVQLRHGAELGARLIDQTQRRVLEGRKVPALQKLVSVFQWHTDILVKDRRDTYYGHKLCLSFGPSSMVLDCRVLSGNTADVLLPGPMLRRHINLYQAPPEQVAFDGAFASLGNLSTLKELGVKQVAFSKRRDIPTGQMTSTPEIYQRLRRFRAGAEGCISFLKRALGLGRCTWKGPQGFAAYVWASVVSANLLLLARHLL